MQQVDRLAAVYPSRPAGGAADTDAASDLAARFKADGLQVTTATDRLRVADGRADVVQVFGRRTGSGAGGVIVVAAARDGFRTGSRAEQTGTATLLELSGLLGKRRVEHSIVLASVSGTLGQGGYRALAKRLSGGEPVRAVIVLGTLGTRDLAAPVVVFSNGPELASQRLRNTVNDALRAQRPVGPARAGAAAQLARLAAPVTTGGQGPLLRAGLPAILLSTTGDRLPPAGLQPDADRLEADGRAVLSSVIAIDNAGAVALGPEQRLVAGDGVIPGWAIRAIVLALLVPPALLVVDGLARARREHQRVGRWVLWTLLLGMPQLLGVAGVALAARFGWLDLPGGPIDPAIWSGSFAPLVVFTVLTVLGHGVVRPLLLEALGLRGRRSTVPGAPLGLSVVLVVLALAVWTVNPAVAAIMVPAVVLWPVVLDTGLRPSRGWSLLVVLIGLAPLLLLLANLLTRYPLENIASSASWFVALIGAGDVGLLPQLWFVLLSGCSIGALILAWHGRSTDPGDADVTVRGPVSYAGPGSLGAVDSALDRPAPGAVSPNRMITPR